MSFDDGYAVLERFLEAGELSALRAEIRAEDALDGRWRDPACSWVLRWGEHPRAAEDLAWSALRDDAAEPRRAIDETTSPR